MLRRHLLLFSVSALFFLFALLALAQTTQATPPAAPLLQLTFDKAVNVRPAWSPDNRSIAYQSNRDSETYHLYVMNADGSNHRALTKGATDNRHPAWTPDGKSILFDSHDGKSREIWKIDLADGRLTQLTRLGGLSNFAGPSPDGQQFSFFFYKDDIMNLWSARMDGNDANPLTRGLASAQNNNCTFACHQAAWSPDSQTLAYSSGDHKTVWTVRRDGSAANQVMIDDGHSHFPWFLGDGRLGYIVEHVSSSEAYTAAWAYDFKTGKATELWPRMSLQGPFAWSNDGKRLLFHSPRSGNFQIYLIDLGDAAGVNVLRGTPVPAQPAASAPVAVPPTTLQTNAADNLIVALGVGSMLIASIAVVFGVFLWRRLRG